MLLILFLTQTTTLLVVSPPFCFAIPSTLLTDIAHGITPDAQALYSTPAAAATVIKLLTHPLLSRRLRETWIIVKSFVFAIFFWWWIICHLSLSPPACRKAFALADGCDEDYDELESDSRSINVSSETTKRGSPGRTMPRRARYSATRGVG